MLGRLIAVVAAALSVVLPAAGLPVTQTSGRTLVWSDGFNTRAGKSPDSGKWHFDLGGNGWGNTELQCYTSSRVNASTDGHGKLVISAVKDPNHNCGNSTHNTYTSARITTQNSFNITHGRLQIRAKVPAGVGTWPAFWALGSNINTVGWPHSGEIDVMEYVGRLPYRSTSSVHGMAWDTSHWYMTRVHASTKKLSAGFHTYAVDWTSTKMTFLVDGKATGSVTKKDVLKHGEWVFDKPFYLLTNLAVGGMLGGAVPSSTTWPQKLVIDYIRVYH